MRNCPSCGRENPAGFEFCGYCRAPLVASEPAAEVRKTVTVLFCDVTGSTSMGEQLDPESMRKVMSRFFEEMQAIIERHGGTVEKFIGDAIMAVFGIPSVHEDDALRAVRAAAEMRETLGTLNKELERDRGVTIASRIGVNTGEVVAGDPRVGQTLVTGDAVNVAARLEQAAAPGEILIGSTTMRLVPDAVVAEGTEPLTVKGKTTPVAAYRLEHVAPGAAGVARHLDAPMVGREQELQLLHSAFDEAVRGRRSQLATVLGAAGVGKSRLTEEFVAAHAADALVIRGQCLSYGDGITYWPIVEMLTAVAGIDEMDEADQVRAKIGALFGASPDAAIAVERLAQFLGVAGAAAAPEETHWAVRKLFEALAATRPTVAVFEDIHWAEPALLDLIEHVAERSTSAPILLLTTGRPDLLEDRAGWGGGEADATSVLLEPLSGEESGEMIANLLGQPGTVSEEIGRIVDAAEGNPLIVEQMVAMLIDDGILRKEGQGWIVEGDLSSVSLPPTIAGLLEARLDRLSPDEQAVIERASVEGRVFHWGSVTALSSDLSSGDVSRHLRALVRRDLIGADEAIFGGTEAFRFRHALIRDAAYERMPKETRADLHERHAAWLEDVAGEHGVEFEEVLAYHFEQAYVLRSELGPVDEHGREMAAEAARRLESSGRRAIARGDLRAASSLLERAVGLMDRDDLRRIDLLLLLGTTSTQAGDLTRAAVAFDEGLEANARIGDRQREIRGRLGRFQLMSATEPEGVTAQIKREAEAAIPVLEELGDDEGLARAWNSLCEVGIMWCRAADMESASERAVFHAERAGDRAALSDAVTWRMLAPWLGMASPHVGIQRSHEMRATAPGDRLVDAIADFVDGSNRALLGHFDEGRRMHRRGQDILADLGLKLNIGGMETFVARLEVMAGDLEAAERSYQKSMQMLESIGEIGYLSTLVGSYGHVLYAMGRFEEASEKADVAERLGAADDVATQTVWRQLRAKLLALDGQMDAANALVEEAVAMTDGTDCWDTLDSAYEDLGEVYRLTGRRDDASRALGKALDVCERKGAVAVAEKVRSQIAALEGAGP